MAHKDDGLTIPGPLLATSSEMWNLLYTTLFVVH